MKRSSLVLGLALFLSPALFAHEAKAGPSLAGSIGFGGVLTPERGFQATNLMLAPGWDFLGFLRPELGFVGSYQQAVAGNYKGLGLELRPMLVLTAPLIPLYGRLIFAATNPFSSTRNIAYGGALGLSLSLLGFGVFTELGILPRSVNNVVSWIMEGRAGAYYAF